MVDVIKKILGVIVEKQTYLNIFYLLLSFPLGVFYFVFLVTGLSLGVSLVIIWIGIPILLLMLFLWSRLVEFEKSQAISLLGAGIRDIKIRSTKEKNLWKRLLVRLSDPVTWKGLLFLLLKFPIGIFSFVILVLCFSITVSFFGIGFLSNYYVNIDQIEIVSLAIGIVALLLSLHLLNALAFLEKWIAELLLNNAVLSAKKKMRKVGSKEQITRNETTKTVKKNGKKTSKKSSKKPTSSIKKRSAEQSKK